MSVKDKYFAKGLSVIQAFLDEVTKEKESVINNLDDFEQALKGFSDGVHFGLKVSSIATKSAQELLPELDKDLLSDMRS